MTNPQRQANGVMEFSGSGPEPKAQYLDTGATSAAHVSASISASGSGSDSYSRSESTSTSHNYNY